MTASAPAKTVLITGGTDGLGKAAARMLAERGWRVFVSGRSAEKRAQMDALARERKLSIETVEMDVCSDASVIAAVRAVIARAGALDALVNNAGVGYVAAVEDFRMEDLRAQFETNFFGVVRVTQAVLPHMREQRRGRILMISSVAGLVVPPTYAAYSGSKFALEGLSNALRLEVAPFGIQVVLIEPGYIITSFQQTAADFTQPYAEKIKSGPYAKIYEGAWAGAKSGRAKAKATPDDFARVVLRALESSSPSARYGVTALATFAAFARRVFPDWALDAFLRHRFHIPKKV